MASLIALTEAQKHLPELLDRVDRGEEILIEREGRPSMKLVAVEDKPSGAWRVGGQKLLGIAYIPPDFDQPMTQEELKDWGL